MMRLVRYWPVGLLLVGAWVLAIAEAHTFVLFRLRRALRREKKIDQPGPVPPDRQKNRIVQ